MTAEEESPVTMDLPRLAWWLWLFGPCGSGKTATGFELYRQLGADGHRIGFIEIDQLGMCGPDDDRIRAPIKTANLLAALRNFNDIGVDGLIVSGDLAGPPMEEILRLCGPQQPILVRLRADADTYKARLLRRGAPQSYIGWSRTYDSQFTRVGDIEMDTDGRTVSQVATKIRHELGLWPRPQSTTQESFPDGRVVSSVRDGQAVLISGPTPVGKSTVAWQVFMHSLADGVPTAYLDLAQVGFLRTFDDHRVMELKARNVGAMSANFATCGARRFILSGDVQTESDLNRLRRALPNTALRVYTLTATAETLVARALLRGEGNATELPGDELRGRPRQHLEPAAIKAAQRAAALPRLPGARYLPTENRDPSGIAGDIAADAFHGTKAPGT